MKRSPWMAMAVMVWALAHGKLSAGEDTPRKTETQTGRSPAVPISIRIANVSSVLEGSKKHQRFAREIMEAIQTYAEEEKAEDSSSSSSSKKKSKDKKSSSR